MKKTKKEDASLCVDELVKEIDLMKQEKAELLAEIEGLRDHNERLMKDYISLEDRFNKEHKERMMERSNAGKLHTYLGKRIVYFSTQLETEQARRKVEMTKRRNSIPKFVIVSAVAMVLLTVPFTLQSLAVIGPQLGFGIEAALMMVISFCYAIIWDRSRNN